MLVWNLFRIGWKNTLTYCDLELRGTFNEPPPSLRGDDIEEGALARQQSTRWTGKMSLALLWLSFGV